MYGFATSLISDRARLHTSVTVPVIFAVLQVAFHLSTEVKYIQLSKIHGMNLCTGLHYFFLYFSTDIAFCHVELSTLSSICSELLKNYSLTFHITQSDT